MKTKVQYEWDYEVVDKNGDIIDHNHADTLLELVHFLERSHLGPGRAVLVRDAWRSDGELTGRLWAYIEDGELPEFFDGAGVPTALSVPRWAHREIKKLRHRLTTAIEAQHDSLAV